MRCRLKNPPQALRKNVLCSFPKQGFFFFSSPKPKKKNVTVLQLQSDRPKGPEYLKGYSSPGAGFKIRKNTDALADQSLV